MYVSPCITTEIKRSRSLLAATASYCANAPAYIKLMAAHARRFFILFFYQPSLSTRSVFQQFNFPEPLYSYSLEKVLQSGKERITASNENIQLPSYNNVRSVNATNIYAFNSTGIWSYKSAISTHYSISPSPSISITWPTGWSAISKLRNRPIYTYARRCAILFIWTYIYIGIGRCSASPRTLERPRVLRRWCAPAFGTAVDITILYILLP